jgi:hypothetical protein
MEQCAPHLADHPDRGGTPGQAQHRQVYPVVRHERPMGLNGCSVSRLRESEL